MFNSLLHALLRGFSVRLTLFGLNTVIRPKKKKKETRRQSVKMNHDWALQETKETSLFSFSLVLNHSWIQFLFFFYLSTSPPKKHVWSEGGISVGLVPVALCATPVFILPAVKRGVLSWRFVLVHAWHWVYTEWLVHGKLEPLVQAQWRLWVFQLPIKVSRLSHYYADFTDEKNWICSGKWLTLGRTAWE